MATPLRDSWLAHALRDGGDGERTSRGKKRTGEEGLSHHLVAVASIDAALVERLRAGDAAALTDVIAETAPALTRYAERFLHDVAEAEDVVQEVFARLWARRDTLAITTTVRAYLFGAVRNATLNVRKHRHIVTAHAAAAAAETQGSFPVSPGEIVLSRLTVDQLLAHLPERRREAVVLRYLGELSYAEVAALLGTTRVNAERLVARSLDTLRDMVGAGKKL